MVIQGFIQDFFLLLRGNFFATPTFCVVYSYRPEGVLFYEIGMFYLIYTKHEILEVEDSGWEGIFQDFLHNNPSNVSKFYIMSVCSETQMLKLLVIHWNFLCHQVSEDIW